MLLPQVRKFQESGFNDFLCGSTLLRSYCITIRISETVYQTTEVKKQRFFSFLSIKYSYFLSFTYIHSLQLWRTSFTLTNPFIFSLAVACFAITMCWWVIGLLPVAVVCLRYFYSRRVIRGYLKKAMSGDMGDIEGHYMRSPGRSWIHVVPRWKYTNTTYVQGPLKDNQSCSPAEHHFQFWASESSEHLHHFLFKLQNKGWISARKPQGLF